MTLEVAFEVGRLYNPIAEIASVLTAPALSPFDMLINAPALRALYAFGPVTTLGTVIDQSGNANNISPTGGPVLDIAGDVGCMTFDGATQYLSRASNSLLAVTGTETEVAPGRRGLTVGGWFKSTGAITVLTGLISKWQTAGDLRSYALTVATTSQPRFFVSQTGANQAFATAPAISGGQWFFAAGRFVPSSTIDIFANGGKTVTSTAWTSINSAPATLNIARHDGGSYLGGDAAMCFVIAAAMPDDWMQRFYLSSKTLFP